eukprot:1159145-Pelagomonas_calceolata.AAC.13
MRPSEYKTPTATAEPHLGGGCQEIHRAGAQPAGQAQNGVRLPVHEQAGKHVHGHQDEQVRVGHAGDPPWGGECDRRQSC